MYLQLNEIKKQVNIDKWFTEDDDYLMSLGEVAEQIVDEHINNNLANILEDNDGNLPAPIRQAMLLLVGNLYQNREGISFTQAYEIPLAYSYLLFPYKDYKNNQS